MSLAMKAAIVRTPRGAFALEDAWIEDPRADEVLVRVVACGVCHTDAVMRDQEAPVPLPAVLGHEGSGVVVKVGAEVTGLAPGDPVVMSFHSCGECSSCADHAPAYCHEFFPRNFQGRRTDGSTGVSIAGEPINANIFGQSAFATYALCHEDNAIKAPAGVPLEILGPLGCGIQTGAGAVLNALKVRPGASIVVLGAGAVGLSAVMAARLAGAAVIVAADRTPARLALALELGATHAVDTRDDLASGLRAILRGGFDHILDTTGAPALVEGVVRHLATRGVLALVGAYPPEAALTLKMNSVMSYGRSVRGVVEGDSEPQVFIPELIDHFLAGRFPFDRLIRFYDFADINQAMADSLNGTTIKPVLRMPR